MIANDCITASVEVYSDMEFDEICEVNPPAEPIVKSSMLQDKLYVVQENDEGKYTVFIDKILPPLKSAYEPHDTFSPDYFIAMHKLVHEPGPSYSRGTPNYLGARIPLQHTGLNLPRWRYYLRGYENVDVCQFLEYGFPLGLQSDLKPGLKSATRNHGSAHQFYTWIDEFLQTGLKLGDIVGPFQSSPFEKVHVSPLMTAVKKPSGRRAVFDASFGDVSLNDVTHPDTYLGEQILYTFPKIEDFKSLVLDCGQGCFMWKRDLKRYFLQIPLDP